MNRKLPIAILVPAVTLVLSVAAYAQSNSDVSKSDVNKSDTGNSEMNNGDNGMSNQGNTTVHTKKSVTSVETKEKRQPSSTDQGTQEKTQETTTEEQSSGSYGK